MVLSSRLRPDRGERAVGDEVAAQVHGNLAGLDDLTLPRLGEKVVAGDIEVLADIHLYLVDAHVGLGFSDQVLRYPGGELHQGLVLLHQGVGDQ